MSLSISIHSRLRHQHETLAELIEGLSETELKQRVIPEKWSAFENIAHLAAYQPAFIQRLQKILESKGGLPDAGEAAPFFERYVAENDPMFPAYLEKSLQDLLTDLAVNRVCINAILLGPAGDVGREDGERTSEIDLHLTGRHKKFGLLTVVQWTEFFLLHEAHHLFTIFKLSQEFRTGPRG